ncbi:MAG: hypothetical protein WCA51_03025 [Dehalococcoidia bacterium]
MEFTYKPIQYFWLWVRCILTSTGTAFTVAGYISLLGETSVGYTIYGNVTGIWNTEKMNTFTTQATFFAFIGVLLAGLLWAIILTVYKRVRKENPTIFGSNADKRLDSLEKKITAIEDKIGKHGL